MKNIKYTLFLVVLASFFSCQSEPAKTKSDQPITFANFYVRYMQSENRIKATAFFDQGKSEKEAISLKIKNGVFFHNANMNEREIPKVGTRYNYELDGDFSDNFKFRFTEPSNGKMNYEVKINPIQKISIPKISKSKGMTVAWEGKPLAENESLVFLIKGEKGNPIHFELKGKTVASEIAIPASKIRALTLGTAKIEIVRKQFITTEKSNFIAQCNSEFYARATDTTVVP